MIELHTTRTEPTADQVARWLLAHGWREVAPPAGLAPYQRHFAHGVGMQETVVRVPLPWPESGYGTRAQMAATLTRLAMLHGMRGSLDAWEEVTREN